MPRNKEQLRKAYKGILKKPIKVSKFSPPPTLLTGKGMLEIEEKYSQNHKKEFINATGEMIKQLHERSLALMKHYDIDPDDSSAWKDLAFELAFDHVPGFRIETGAESGRPEVWNEFILAKLYFDVEKLTSNCNRNIGAACKALSKTAPWNSDFLKTEISEKTLRNRYSEAKSSCVVQAYLKIRDQNKSELIESYIEMVEKICSEQYF